MRYFPHILAAGFALFWVALAWSPADRTVWWAENLPILLTFLLFVFTFRSFRFSNLAYGFAAMWLVLHTIGGHYTFANVPFDWITDWFGFTRNHFDRVAHFSIGFYAFPITELLLRQRLATFKTALCFGLFAIMALAAAYEIVEWWYAVLVGGSAGAEFLGSQGDIWDAQKDMLADTLGAITALTVLALRQKLASPK